MATSVTYSIDFKMTPKIFPILEMCIENGVSLGYSRAFKHNDTPTEKTIKENIFRAIIEELDQWFDISENNKPS